MAYVYQQYGAGDAVSEGWRVFKARWWLFVPVAALPAVVDHVSRFLLGVPTLGIGTVGDNTIDGFGTFALIALVAGVVLVVHVAVSALVARWALAGIDRDPRTAAVQAKDVMPRFGPYLGWSFAVAGLSVIGVLFCFVGFFAVQFFAAWVPFLVLEGRPSPLKLSFDGVRDYVREVGLFFGCVVAAHLIGVVLTFFLKDMTFVGPAAVGVAVAVIWAWATCGQASVYRASCESEPNAVWDSSVKHEAILSWAIEGTYFPTGSTAPPAAGSPPPPVGRPVPAPSPYTDAPPPPPPPPVPPADTSQPPPGW